ncbi:MAG: hypothetical protein AVO33_08805 [delta proteobacterium ML8_F1]|nr:MAG: hypothetical protein AVO33_08805 [delta proteobacterium ML8_F1]
MTGKQRSFLKSLSNPLRPMMQLGKGGLTPEALKQIDQLLNDHELLKINILNNCPGEPVAIARALEEELKTEFVSALGHKLVVYRASRTKEKANRIQLP